MDFVANSTFFIITFKRERGIYLYRSTLDLYIFLDFDFNPK